MIKNKKKKYIAILVIKEQGNYNRIKKKRFNPPNFKIRYKKDMFLIKYRYPTYVRGLKLFYFIDVKTGAQINFRKLIRSNYSPSEINLILGDGVIKQMVSGLGQKSNIMDIMLIVLGVIIGVPSGIIIAGYI